MKPTFFNALAMLALTLCSTAQANEPISAQDCTVYVRMFENQMYEIPLNNPFAWEVEECRHNYGALGTEAANEVLSILTNRGYRIVGLGVAAGREPGRPVSADFTFTFGALSGCNNEHVLSGTRTRTKRRIATVGLRLVENSTQGLVAVHLEAVRQRRASRTLIDVAEERIPQCIRTGQ